MTEFNGICFGLVGAAGRPCKVVPQGTALEATIDGVKVAVLSYRGLTVSLQGVGDRYICFEGRFNEKDVRLLVPDRGILAVVESLGAPGPLVEQFRRISQKRAARKIARNSTVGVLLGLVIAIVLVVWFGFDWAVSRAVRAVPVAWEEELGRVSANAILAETQVCGDPELNKATEEIGMRLIGAIGPSPYAFKMVVLDANEVNAFALPGGYLFLNRGLVSNADDGAEVAGVLAHEIQHVLLRHGLNNLIRESGIRLLLNAVIGDMGQMERFLASNAAGLAAMSYNRDQEREADQKGIALLRRAALDMTGLPRFLAKLASAETTLGGLKTLVSSHPSSKERMNELEIMVSAQKGAKVVPLNASWTDIRHRCAPQQFTGL